MAFTSSRTSVSFNPTLTPTGRMHMKPQESQIEEPNRCRGEASRMQSSSCSCQLCTLATRSCCSSSLYQSNCSGQELQCYTKPCLNPAMWQGLIATSLPQHITCLPQQATCLASLSLVYPQLILPTVHLAAFRTAISPAQYRPEYTDLTDDAFDAGVTS